MNPIILPPIKMPWFMVGLYGKGIAKTIVKYTRYYVSVLLLFKFSVWKN